MARRLTDSMPRDGAAVVAAAGRRPDFAARQRFELQRASTIGRFRYWSSFDQCASRNRHHVRRQQSALRSTFSRGAPHFMTLLSQGHVSLLAKDRRSLARPGRHAPARPARRCASGPRPEGSYGNMRGDRCPYVSCRALQSAVFVSRNVFDQVTGHVAGVPASGRRPTRRSAANPPVVGGGGMPAWQ